MTYAITVYKTPEFLLRPEEPLFHETFASYDDFKNSLGIRTTPRSDISWPEMLEAPVRTDNFINFCKDFFLPGFFNVALKINKLSFKIFVGMSMVFWDIVTLPIRVFTTLPRYRYNAEHSKEANPFYRYLIEKGVPAEKLNVGCVYLKSNDFEWKYNFIELPISANSINEGREIVKRREPASP